MLRHGVLQGDTDLRELALAVGRILGDLMPQGVPWFSPLGIRNRKPGQEVRAFWSIPDHECGVRLVLDLVMGVVMISVESAADALGATVFEVLAREIPCVSIDTILDNESRFEEMPELVFLAALSVRHAPTDRVVAIVKQLLTAPSEDVRVCAVGAAAVLNGDELVSAVKAAGGREDLSPAAQRVFETSIRNMETRGAAWNRDKPFADPEEVFLVRW
jgi:hypothetical protein